MRILTLKIIVKKLFISILYHCFVRSQNLTALRFRILQRLCNTVYSAAVIVIYIARYTFSVGYIRQMYTHHS